MEREDEKKNQNAGESPIFDYLTSFIVKTCSLSQWEHLHIYYLVFNEVTKYPCCRKINGHTCNKRRGENVFKMHAPWKYQPSKPLAEYQYKLFFPLVPLIELLHAKWIAIHEKLERLKYWVNVMLASAVGSHKTEPSDGHILNVHAATNPTIFGVKWNRCNGQER